MVNQFPGRCFICGLNVAAGSGRFAPMTHAASQYKTRHARPGDIGWPRAEDITCEQAAVLAKQAADADKIAKARR